MQFGWRPPQLSQDLALTLAGPASNLILAGKDLLEAASSSCPMAKLPGSASDPAWFIDRAISFCDVRQPRARPRQPSIQAADALDGLYRPGRNVSDGNAGLIVGSLGVVLATLSTLVLFGSLLAGMAIYSPPDFRSNLEALRAARRAIHLPQMARSCGFRLLDLGD